MPILTRQWPVMLRANPKEMLAAKMERGDHEGSGARADMENIVEHKTRSSKNSGGYNDCGRTTMPRVMAVEPARELAVVVGR